MFPFDPMCPLVVLLGCVSTAIEVHFFLLVILASTIDVYSMFWFRVNDSFEELLRFIEVVIGGVAGLNIVRTNHHA